MIGVDWGSKEIKWFDGKDFGFGTPKRGSLTVGLSSVSVLVKRSFFPLCKGSQLKRLVLNEVISELSLPKEKVALAYCPVKRFQKGCEFLIFVEKREVLDSLPKEVREKSRITVDLVGALTSLKLLYPQEELTLLDLGEGKVSLIEVGEEGVKELEVVRGSYRRERVWRELLPKLKRERKLLLTGGGAFNREIREVLKEFNPQVPSFPPFNEKAPLFFNAFGLYNFNKGDCKALFSSSSLLSSEFIEKNRDFLIKSGALFGLSLLLFTASQLIELQATKRDYLELKREVKKELSQLLGEKVLIPEVQLEEKLEKLKELYKLLQVDKPTALNYLKAISQSVPSGITVLEVKGSASSGSFTITGQGKGIKEFVENLKKMFERVSISEERSGKFTITVWRLKVGSKG
ncbi:hypothetical protein [Thermovibrio sp.]